MPEEALRDFEAIRTRTNFAKGEVLFAEGRPAKGIYILCEGRARLSICSESGKRLMLRIAGPGEVLGAGAALSGGPCEVTAEMLDNAQVAVVRRKDLLRFLRDHRDVCLVMVSMLSQDLHAAYERVRSLGITKTRRPRSSNGRDDG